MNDFLTPILITVIKKSQPLTEINQHFIIVIGNAEALHNIHQISRSSIILYMLQPPGYSLKQDDIHILYNVHQ